MKGTGMCNVFCKDLLEGKTLGHLLKMMYVNLCCSNLLSDPTAYMKVLIEIRENRSQRTNSFYIYIF